jgi:hypothetical protein
MSPQSACERTLNVHDAEPGPGQSAVVLPTADAFGIGLVAHPVGGCLGPEPGGGLSGDWYGRPVLVASASAS